MNPAILLVPLTLVAALLAALLAARPEPRPLRMPGKFVVQAPFAAEAHAKPVHARGARRRVLNMLHQRSSARPRPSPARSRKPSARAPGTATAPPSLQKWLVCDTPPPRAAA